jgi:TonB family protein
MSSDFQGLGLIDPERRRKASPAGAGKAPRKPSGAPPFRRSRSGLPGAAGGPAPASPAGRLFAGLSRGGTLDDLTGVSVRRRAAVAGASTGFHLLLLLLFLGGLVPVAPEPGAADPVEEPLLYAFEAPPLDEAEPVEALVEPLPPVPLPEETAPEAAQPAPPPPAAGLVIPEAQIATPNTGFQNDLPFSEGDDEEFYVDHEMGDELSAEDDLSASTDGTEPERLAEIPEIEDAAAAAEAAAEPPVEPGGFDVSDPPLQFDAEAFRRLINDPAADVRRMGDELAMREARAQAEAERRKEGAPTDIWRFLEGKRFRNPEGGLVSNRNNTLYYDDRGANLVPWISRLIAEVRRNWYIPYAASYDRGHVAIAISVLRSGQLAWLQVVIPSGVPGFDNAAVGALRGAQLLPLPDDYPGADFEIMLVFWYNEQPYDLFNTQD